MSVPVWPAVHSGREADENETVTRSSETTPAAKDGGAPSGDVLDFLGLFWALDHALQSRSKRMRSTLGITAPQRLVVRILGRTPGISAGQLAAALHLNPSTVTGILQRMKTRGLVARRADPRDGRRAILELTEKGLALDVPSEESIEHWVAKTLETLPPASVAAAREVLESMARAIDTGPPESASRRGRAQARRK